MSNLEKKEAGEPNVVASPDGPVGADASAAPKEAAPEPAPASQDAATKPASTKEVNRTIQLDVGQVDLLDVPLPPSSSPKIQEGASKTNKGPPPLPPALPDQAAAPASPAGVSARQLLEGGQTASTGNSALRFALGLGVATIICVALWFGLKAVRKPAPAITPVASAASAPAPASASAEAPMRTITIAPIEMTGPSLGAGEDKPAASASGKPAAAASSPASPASTTRPPAAGTTGKPRAGDDLIKVEN